MRKHECYEPNTKKEDDGLDRCNLIRKEEFHEKRKENCFHMIEKKMKFANRKICFSKEKNFFEKLFAFLIHYHIIHRDLLINSPLMDATLIAAIQATTSQKSDDTRYKTGMEVEVHQIIKDGDKERIQLFRGLIISMKGKTQLDKVITVRADIDGIGIEKIFPINSPYISKIVVLRQFKVRRNNIGYIRELTGKAARLKEIK